MTDTTEPNTPPLEFVPYPQQAPNACRTTRHCADHGFCRRCQPEFSAVMSRVNSAIQRTDSDERHWGPLYAAVAEALRGSHATAPVVVPAADRAALRDRIAEAVRAFPFDDFGMDDVSYALEAAPDSQEWVPKLADVVLSVLPAPADRAAVLTTADAYRLAADAVRATIAPADWPSDAISIWNAATNIAEHRLLRMAAEARSVGTSDSGANGTGTSVATPAESAVVDRVAAETPPAETLDDYERTTGHLITCLAVAGGASDPDCCRPAVVAQPGKLPPMDPVHILGIGADDEAQPGKDTETRIVRCSRAILSRPHEPHGWYPQPGMDPVDCPGHSFTEDHPS
jgi:hypothetical protein